MKQLPAASGPCQYNLKEKLVKSHHVFGRNCRAFRGSYRGRNEIWYVNGHWALTSFEYEPVHESPRAVGKQF